MSEKFHLGCALCALGFTGCLTCAVYCINQLFRPTNSNPKKSKSESL